MLLVYAIENLKNLFFHFVLLNISSYMFHILLCASGIINNF